MSLGSARVRLFVIKEGDGFEVLRHEVFEDKLLSSPKSPVEKSDGRWILSDKELVSHEINRMSNVDWVKENISNIGWDGVDESIKEILEPYTVEDVVEILADYVIEGRYGSGWDGDDYDEDHWLENIQQNKLRDVEIERFIGKFKRGEDGMIEFDKEVFSFNHGGE